MPKPSPGSDPVSPEGPPVNRPIGVAGEPARVLAFAGGGFETVRQLGVVHALLVSRGRAPHMVIGSSAGAVNAVAAAEILQAGAPPAQVARFREVFESYRTCSGDLAAAMLPDTYEIDVHRPVEQLRLPIQAHSERDIRGRSLDAKAGLLNLYNDLLRLRISIGTATRFIRRGLGIAAAGAEPKRWKRVVVTMVEVFRTWTLVGYHLGELAPLAGLVVRAAFGWRAHEKGAPAAHLIFRSHLFAAVKGTTRFSAGFVLVLTAWTLASAPLLLILAGALHSLSWLTGCEWGQLLPVDGIRWDASLGTGIGQAALAAAVLDLAAGVVGGVIFARKVRAGREPSSQNEPRHANRRLLAIAIGFALAVILLALVVVLGTGLLPAGAVADAYVALLHNAAVAAVAILFTGILVGLAAASHRETAQADELLGSIGAAGGFLAVNGLVFVILLGLAWACLRWNPSGYPFVPLAWALLVATQGAILGLIALVWCGPTLPVNLLRRYDLANGLFNEHPIRQFFVRLFDRDYYGLVPMDQVLEQAMQYGDKPYRNPGQGPKTFDGYDAPGATPPINVGVTATDVSAVPASGWAPLVSVLPPTTKVVDGLLAAMAVTPLLPPQRVDGKLYIDAANVTNEPTGAALDHLRDRLHPGATDLRIYAVTHLPLSSAILPALPGHDYGELLDVVLRARQLERLRDARLDRNLTDLFTRSLPPESPVMEVQRPNGPHRYLRASIFPLEPDQPGEVNGRIFTARTGADRRRIIAETVADGCRSALETILGATVAGVAAQTSDPPYCREVVAALLQNRYPGQASRTLPGSAPPGSGPDRGPGLAEVCEHCALRRTPDGPKPKSERRLVVLPPDRLAAEWPGEGAPLPDDVNPPMPPEHPGRRLQGVVWPLDRGCRSKDQAPRADAARPTVSLLFSGGVFRGVYQLGALNALNEAGLQPDVIAGASVGSITAAMIARVFAEPSGPWRQHRIARLAAVYLGVDRLVMTDRFADFIRAVTVRAAHTNFSIRDADRVFRRYDAPWTGVYEREVRRVLAGLERLFYVSPFEIRDLVEEARREHYDETGRLARVYLQEWLNRVGVSNQVLGSEPLKLLIEQFVLDDLAAAPSAPMNAGATDSLLHHFRGDGICFLTTVTNLTRGRLEVLGKDQLLRGHHEALLGESLLASSAFPGVFRPRWAWEFLPGRGTMDRYIDGGVTDNLPLDAVAQFLLESARSGAIQRRPIVNGVAVPHLLLAASLEPRLESLGMEELRAAKRAPNLSRAERRELDRRLKWRRDQVREMADNWPKLSARTGRLKYNLKLDVYAQAQRALREIVQHRGPGAHSFTPLDLEVIAVKPAWLCGTFAFHPMMGFRRKRQAQSIAHGCFTTLVRLGRLYHGGADAHPAWADAWGLDPSALPGPEVLTQPVLEGKAPLRPLPATSTGRCCVRPDVTCPFSRASATAALGDAAMSHTLAELDGIYRLCCETETHHADNQ